MEWEYQARLRIHKGGAEKTIKREKLKTEPAIKRETVLIKF